MKFNAVFNLTQELTGLDKMNFNIYNYLIYIIIYTRRKTYHNLDCEVVKLNEERNGNRLQMAPDTYISQ